jgi:hypothetical protein
VRKVGIDELSGRSVFYKDANGDVFHTYSSYGRGGDLMLGTYNILDLMPKGRNEIGPNHNMTDWVRHHDRYASGGGYPERPVSRIFAAPGPALAGQTENRAQGLSTPSSEIWG